MSDSCDPINCSLLGSSVYGILQARIPEWAAISFSRGTPQPRNWTQVSHMAGRCFTDWTTQEAPLALRSFPKIDIFHSNQPQSCPPQVSSQPKWAEMMPYLFWGQCLYVIPKPTWISQGVYTIQPGQQTDIMKEPPSPLWRPYVQVFLTIK